MNTMMEPVRLDDDDASSFFLHTTYNRIKATIVVLCATNNRSNGVINSNDFSIVIS